MNESQAPPYLESLELGFYKQIHSFKIHNLNAQQVVIGPNGVGKSTILSAIVLWLRGYNTLMKNDGGQRKDHVVLQNRELGRLVNNVDFEGVPADHLLCSDKPSSEPTVVKAKINGKEFTCTIDVDKGLKISPTPQETIDQKIRFAFVNYDTQWGPATDEVVNDTLTSSTKNTRRLFKNLQEDAKEHITNALSDMFPGVSNFRFDFDEHNLMVTTPTSKVEIMYMGAAFRTVFVTLVLLHMLLEFQESCKVFLMEEPEALLYPSLQEAFLNQVLVPCGSKIQLIMTSNSQKLLDNFPLINIYALQPESGSASSGIVLSDWPDILSHMGLKLLGVPLNQPVVLCEGTNNPLFVREVAHHFKLELSKGIQFVQLDGQTDSSKLRMAVDILRQRQSTLHPPPPILVFLDQDFGNEVSLQGKIKKLQDKKVEVIYWDYPSLESYSFTSRSLARSQLLTVLKSPMKNSSSTTINFYKCNQKWNKMKSHAYSKCGTEMSLKELKKLSRFIHSHTWVEKICHITRTPALFPLITPDITQHCPEILRSSQLSLFHLAKFIQMQALYSLRQRGAIAQGLGTRTAQIAAEAIVKSTLSYGLCMTELSKSWWKKIEAVWNETARSVLQVHRRTVAGVCRAELGWLTIKAYCELERQAVIHHAERQDGHFELLEEVSQASEEEGEKNEGEGGDGTTVVEKKAKRMRTLTRVAKVEYAAEGERGTRAWLWHNFLTNGRCLVGQQRSLVITNPRKERLMNAIHCGGLPIGKKWGAIQQAEEDSKCPACDAEEETAEHFLLRCPNLWEDRFRIWSVDNGNEEQVRKLIIEDCTTNLLSSGKKCNRAQEMEQCKQSCKRVWRLWAARASWKHGSSSAFYQSLEVM
ncbi:hypothetical protein QOT17_025300 [Balamuthia mandrillaris]